MEQKDKYIYIMLSDTGTWLSRLVKKYTDAPYNHVSIGLDASFNHLYSFGRKIPDNPFSGGFVKEDVIKGTYRRFPDTSCIIYQLPVTDKQSRKLNKLIRRFAKKGDKYTYNFIGLFAVAIDKPLKRKASYFCSQFVAEVLARTDIYHFEKESCLVKPADFHHIPCIQKVYEGKLYEHEAVVRKIIDVDIPYFPSSSFSLHQFVQPVRKTIKFINPMYFYHASSRTLQKEKK